MAYLTVLISCLLTSTAATAQLAVSTVPTSPTCNGYTDGSIEAFPSGGQLPYTYQWSNGQSGKTASGIAAGAYTLTVTDATGETATASISVTEPPVLISAIESQGDICAGNTSTFDAAASGGTAPYHFTWSNGETSQTLTNPAPGYYFLTVTDANGCLSVSGLAINEPLSVTVHTIDVVCPLWCDGSAEAIITGGAEPYTFLWNTGATSQVIFPLPPGTFTVTVTDGNGCTAAASGDVSEPPAIVLNFTVQNPCSGSASATISATGGTPPLTYQWSNGATGQSVAGLTEGVWFVTVTDGNGCKKDTSVTVSNGVTFVLTNVENATCDGVANGSATATITSGIGPLSYLWSDGQTTPTATGLAPGTYSVTVTGGAGCTDAATVEIEVETTLELETSATAAGCASSSTGTATVDSVAGGTPPFSYLWSNGQTGQTATGLAAGEHNVTVTDALGCEAIETVVVAQSGGLTIQALGSPATCHNTTDGGAQVTQVSSNAVPPLSYAWSNGATENFIESVLPGSYSVTVTDAQGCTGAMPVSIVSNAGITANFTWETSGCSADTVQVQFTQAVDFFPSNDSIVSWEWQFDDGQTADVPSPLLTFTDSVFGAVLIVENATGCRDTISQIIEIQNVLNVQFQNAAGCLADTIALAAIFDPNDSLNFTWTSGSPTLAILGSGIEPTVIAVATDTGTFVVYVSVENAFGCQLLDSVEVTVGSPDVPFDPALLSYSQCEGLTLDFTNDNAFASAFQWFFNWPDDPTATSTLPDPSYLYPDTGNFTVALILVLNCVTDTFFLDVTVAPPPAADFIFEKTECSDTVTVTFTDTSVTPGSISAWHWEFSTGDTSDLQNPSLTLGASQTLIATLTIEFETGCTASVTDSVEVEIFNPVSPEDTVVACLPVPTAELNPNGDPNFSYQWFPPGGLDDPASWNPTATVVNTTPYMVTITDNSGTVPCSVVKKVTVFVPEALNLTSPADIESCEEGIQTLAAGAAVSPAIFQWSSQSDFSDTLSLEPSLDVNVTSPPVTYYVQATGEYGCSQAGETTVGYYPVMAQVPDFENVCAGEVPAVIIDGLGPDDVVIWSPNHPNGQAPLDTTDFIVTIVNGFGCTLTDTLTVNVVDVSQFIEVVPALDTILQGESVTLSVLSNFNQLCTWSPASSLDDPFRCDPVASPLSQTTYTVEVEDDATGCRGSGQSTICVVNNLCGEPMIFVPNAFTPNGDGLNDVLYVRGYNIERVVIFAIYNRWGEKVFESHSLDEGWDGKYNGRLATGDVFAYYLKVECRTGEEFFKKGNVTVVR